MSESKSCTRCGAEFGCGRNDARCWCQDLPVLPLAALAADADCLCPDCLRARINESRAAIASPADPAD